MRKALITICVAFAAGILFTKSLVLSMIIAAVSGAVFFMLNMSSEEFEKKLYRLKEDIKDLLK